MAEISWIKLRTNMFDDEKIRLIERMPEGDSILVIWIKLLTYAGKVNCNGYIMINENIPMDIEQVSIIFNRPFEKVKYSISVLQKFGMLDVSETETIAITNWEKHQNVEGMDKIRLQNRERKRKQRERSKTLLLEENCHVTVTGSHATDIDKELDKEKDNNTMSNDIEVVVNALKTTEGVPNFVKLTAKRKSAINARIKEYGLEKVLKALENISNSDFLKSSVKTTWYDIDWIFNPNNFVKIEEGKYNQSVTLSVNKDVNSSNQIPPIEYQQFSGLNLQDE